MIIKALARRPPGQFALAAAALLCGLLLVSGQQLLWLPLCALLASSLMAWYWPRWALGSLSLDVRCLCPLRQGQEAIWQVDVASRLPLWGLYLHGPCGMEYSHFIPGRRTHLHLSARPLLTGMLDNNWHCSLHYPFNLWRQARCIDFTSLRVLPALESIDYLPLPANHEPGQVPKALVCCDSSAGFSLGEEVNNSQGVQIKLLANLCRALAAKGYDVSLATGLSLLTAPAHSTGFTTIDEALVDAQQHPATAADLLARYNLRPDAQLIILPQLLSGAPAPELFPGQILWQLLFDEERFVHPLSRSRHFHRRLSAYHWQWVIEPQQPLARLFYVQP
ncbi:MAG TPA: hypothetical protein PK011_09395 [Marinagarivorans sp.]|nr:hypothetical protein [Marinagarivorans sp.]